MAMSATISCAQSTVLINQKVDCTVTVSNSGGSPVNVTGIQPIAYLTGSPGFEENSGLALGLVPLSAGFPVSVPASGSLNFNFSAVFFSPSTGPIGAGSNTYSVSAQCSASDGSNFAPASAATVTVNPLPLPSSEF